MAFSRSVQPAWQYLRVDPNASIPLATQLSQQIAWLIASGKIHAGDQLPAVRNLAADLKINFHTVRAAYQLLEGDGLIQTRRGARAQVLAYDRQRLSQSAPDLPTFAIGVLVPNYSPYYAPFLQGLEEGSAHEPWLLFMGETRYYTRHVARYMDQFVAKNVDGIIVTHFEQSFDPELKAILSPSASLPPIVYADSPGMDGLAVQFDRQGGGYQVTRHLIEHGHQKIGLITPPVQWASIQEVYLGYQRALQEAGIEPQADWISECPDFSLEAGSAAAARLLDQKDPPGAIFASGDMLAIGAMQRAKARGLQPGSDLAIAGFGEVDVAALVEPGLTTVSLPAFQMGQEVMHSMRRKIAGEVIEHRLQTIETRLVVRGSCGC